MGRRPGSLNKKTKEAKPVKAVKPRRARVRFQAREHIPVWRKTDSFQSFMDELGLSDLGQGKRLYKKCIEGVTLIYGETLPEDLNTKIANFYAVVGKRGRAKGRKLAIGQTSKGKLKYAVSAGSIEKAGLAAGDEIEEVISGGQIIVRKKIL